MTAAGYLGVLTTRFRHLPLPLVVLIREPHPKQGKSQLMWIGLKVMARMHSQARAAVITFSRPNYL